MHPITDRKSKYCFIDLQKGIDNSNSLMIDFLENIDINIISLALKQDPDALSMVFDLEYCDKLNSSNHTQYKYYCWLLENAKAVGDLQSNHLFELTFFAGLLYFLENPNKIEIGIVDVIRYVCRKINYSSIFLTGLSRFIDTNSNIDKIQNSYINFAYFNKN